MLRTSFAANSVADLEHFGHHLLPRRAALESSHNPPNPSHCPHQAANQAPLSWVSSPDSEMDD